VTPAPDNFAVFDPVDADSVHRSPDAASRRFHVQAVRNLVAFGNEFADDERRP
jgi:hypothetical protein